MNKLSTVVYGVITLVVVVILIFTIAIPVIEDSQSEQYSTTNNSSELYAIAVTDSTTPITLSLTTDGVYSINGVVYPGDNSNTQNFRFLGENFGARMYHASGGSYRFDVAFKDDNPEVTSNSASTNELTYSDGKITFTYNEVEYSVTSPFFLYPALDGTYGQYNLSSQSARESVFVNKDATIYLSAVGKNYLLVKGTISDLDYSGTLVYKDGSGSAYTYNNINVTTVDSSDNLTYQFENTPEFVLNVVEDNTTTTVNVTSAYVPLEYEYISSSDSMIIALLGIIPLILAIIPVMLAVQLMTGGRRD